MKTIIIQQNKEAERSGLGPQQLKLQYNGTDYSLLSVDDGAPIWLSESQLVDLASTILQTVRTYNT